MRLAEREEKFQLSQLTDSELIAYWNILVNTRHVNRPAECVSQAERHEPMVKELLTERGIPFEDGNVIETVRVSRELLAAA